jgi:hypothetical protein
MTVVRERLKISSPFKMRDIPVVKFSILTLFTVVEAPVPPKEIRLFCAFVFDAQKMAIKNKNLLMIVYFIWVKTYLTNL